MSNSPNDISKPKTQNIETHSDIVKRLATLEEQKITLELQKLDFAKQQDSNTYNYSLKALEIKQESIKHEQELTERFFSKLFWFSGFLVLLLVALVIVSFYYNKEQFIYECLKVIIPLIIGWLGGDAYRSKQFEKQSQNKLQNYSNQ